jgi:hypothetical protein
MILLEENDINLGLKVDYSALSKERIIKNSYHVNLMYYNILLSLKEFASFIKILWLRV